MQQKLEPVVGLEPTTDGLQNRCSTTELNWQTNWLTVAHYAVRDKEFLGDNPDRQPERYFFTSVVNLRQMFGLVTQARPLPRHGFSKI
jgi:hypothetical protein